MFRKDLIELLQHYPATLHELSGKPEEPVMDVEAEVQQLHKPSKCPHCKGSGISELRIAIEERS